MSVVGNRSYRLIYLLPVILFWASCSSRPVEETVTVTPARHSTVSVERPKVSTSQLPVRDPDIEKAGDLIAEATLHLRKRESAAGLHALAQAEAEIKRALDKTAQTRTTHDELLPALGELDTVRAAIHRGMFDDAIRRLGDLNRKLDSLD